MPGLSPSSFVAEIQRLILSTFEISEAEAESQANGMALLAENWGGENPRHLNWPHLVKKRLNSAYPWKSDDERRKFEQHRAETTRAYEFLISPGERPLP